ncbi:hypothetical protein, partial [Mesorhizobium sp. M8A.F.Ca.ET.161.01.1.1]|uniref:hypothetical protein n=1 Tax=Mesorhizobium sp. M8A.F.Ca.ET.161.01.1.1 TaxID=2563959 RepID=UPI001FEFA0E5
ISGSASAPVISGSITTDGTRLTDVRRNLTINDLGATITFDRDRAVISRLTGRLAGGGTISGTPAQIVATPGPGCKLQQPQANNVGLVGGLLYQAF